MAEPAGSVPLRTPDERHLWVFEVLARSGCILDGAGDGFYTYRLGEDLAARWRRDRIRFTFRKRQALETGAELATPGSWLHDELVRLARGKGRVVAVYLSPRAHFTGPALLRERRRTVETVGGLVERRHGILLHFTFRICVYTEPPQEQLLTVAYDVARQRVVRPLPRRAILDASPAPDLGFEPAPAPDLGQAFREAWTAVEDDVEDRVHALELIRHANAGNGHDTVDRYYRQLIEEEKRLLKSRSSRQGTDESNRRIQLLKLEWERRVKEELERSRPQAVAFLAAVARLHVPLERWRCRVVEREAVVERDLWVDLFRGEVWDAPAGDDSAR